jgi:general secretion pathway protein A
MYEKHFGFRERPFALTPDPSFLYRSRKHGMALTMLEYGLINEAPVIVISGEIGAGKTTLIRQLLNQLDEKTIVGLISNTHKAFGELIQWVTMAYGLPHEGKDKVALYRAFVDFLVAEYGRGKRTVLIVDEAQNMDPDTLEELRLISNINADKNLVLQLVLVGQPELRDTLRQKRLEQFAQRIAVDFHLEALELKETREYIQHRLEHAGGNKNIFQPDAILEIFKHAEGVPRLINSLCDTALVYAFAEGRQRVTGRLVAQMVQEKKSRNLFGAGKLRYDEEIDQGSPET